MTRDIEKELSYLGLQAGWTRPMRTHLYRTIGLMGRARVLDVGCADGLVTAEIAERTKGKVTGVDCSADLIERARSGRPGIAFEAADARDLPFAKGSFDAVIVNFTLMWIKRPERALAEARRVLAPGGVLLATGEPDYGGRIDEPASFGVLREAWIEAIRNEGGDPFFGRTLKVRLIDAGFGPVEAGVMPSLWEGEKVEDGRAAYIDSLRYFLADTIADIESIIREERRAARAGRRLVFLPIFWAAASRK